MTSSPQGFKTGSENMVLGRGGRINSCFPAANISASVGSPTGQVMWLRMLDWVRGAGWRWHGAHRPAPCHSSCPQNRKVEHNWSKQIRWSQRKWMSYSILLKEEQIDNFPHRRCGAETRITLGSHASQFLVLTTKTSFHSYNSSGCFQLPCLYCKK